MQGILAPEQGSLQGIGAACEFGGSPVDCVYDNCFHEMGAPSPRFKLHGGFDASRAVHGSCRPAFIYEPRLPTLISGAIEPPGKEDVDAAQPRRDPRG